MEKNGNGRPKVELQLNQPTRLKLLKDKPYEGSSAYGTYLLYSVEHEGVEKAYFAQEDVHRKIEALGVKAGDEIILTKTAGQNGKKNSALVDVALGNRQSAPLVQPVPTGEDNYRSIMERSLREAVEITRSVAGVPFQNEDIQKIASCLFIART